MLRMIPMRMSSKNQKGLSHRNKSHCNVESVHIIHHHFLSILTKSQTIESPHNIQQYPLREVHDLNISPHIAHAASSDTASWNWPQTKGAHSRNLQKVIVIETESTWSGHFNCNAPRHALTYNLEAHTKIKRPISSTTYWMGYRHTHYEWTTDRNISTKKEIMGIHKKEAEHFICTGARHTVKNPLAHYSPNLVILPVSNWFQSGRKKFADSIDVQIDNILIHSIWKPLWLGTILETKKKKSIDIKKQQTFPNRISTNKPIPYIWNIPSSFIVHSHSTFPLSVSLVTYHNVSRTKIGGRRQRIKC